LTLAYNPLDPEHIRDPYPRYQALREADPVHRSDLFQGWVLTRHADVVVVLRDPSFSVDRSQMDLIRNSPLPPVGEEFRGLSESLKRVLMFLDPPDHTRIRGLVVKAFTPRVVESRRERTRQIVDDLLDAAALQGEVDWIRDIAYPLPVIVIAEILGVPAGKRAVFKRWSEEIGVLLDPFVTPEAFERGMKSAVEMQQFFFEIFADRRARPRDDLVSALVAVKEQGEMLSESELFATCALLLGAGHQTTTNLLGNALWALAENPDERRRLQAHPELIDSAVEEFLRHNSPVQVTARVATGDYRIDGKRIEKGDFVILAFGAANRDPAVFREPDRLDLGRDPNPHVSFGQGIHFCLGAPLARMEAQIALDTLLRRFPAFEVSCETPQWKPTVVSRGLASLPIALIG